MADHTNDLSPLSLRRANAKEDAFAYSRFVWKRFRGQCLINYEQVAVRAAVVLRERASGDKSGAHRFEITGQNNLKIGSLKLARISLRIGSAPADGTKSTGERQRKRRGDTSHAGDRAQLFTKLAF